MRPKPFHLVLALAALLALPLAADEATEKPAGKPAAPAAAAMKIHVDPATGQLSAPAPGAQGAPSRAPAASLPKLRVENGTTAAGGKRVRLDDRFMMEMTATAAPGGKAAVTCVESGPSKAPGTEEHRHDR